MLATMPRLLNQTPETRMNILSNISNKNARLAERKKRTGRKSILLDLKSTAVERALMIQPMSTKRRALVPKICPETASSNNPARTIQTKDLSNPRMNTRLITNAKVMFGTLSALKKTPAAEICRITTTAQNMAMNKFLMTLSLKALGLSRLSAVRSLARSGVSFTAGIASSTGACNEEMCQARKSETKILSPRTRLVEKRNQPAR